MYITSECYGISRMLNIKCPLYTSILIHDVILGVKKEPACPANTGGAPTPILNPMCCRPSCNDCFQRDETAFAAVGQECNGLNYCDVQPHLGVLAGCDRNQTEYMAVAYNCQIASKIQGNKTALFSIDQDLCGRLPRVSQIKGVSVPNSTIDTNVPPTTTAMAVGIGTENGTSFTTTTQPQPNNSTSTMYQSTSHHPSVSTMAPVAAEVSRKAEISKKAEVPRKAEVSRKKSQTSTNPAIDTQTTIIHRTPTKRFVPTGRMRISSTSTASTRLIMSNLPESDNNFALGPVNKGAMIGGVAAAAGLLVFVLSLVMIRRRRRKLNPRFSGRVHMFDDSVDDDARGGQLASPVDEVATPTSLSEEGQTPWTFGPPDLNYATIHTDGGHISANIQDITPVPAQPVPPAPPAPPVPPPPPPRDRSGGRQLYAVVNRNLSATPVHAGAQLYGEMTERSANALLPTPVTTLAVKQKPNRRSYQGLWRQNQSTSPRYINEDTITNTLSPR